MLKKTNPPHFAYEEFKIKNADFYNVDLANDNALFLNPYEIEMLDHPVAKKATAVAIDFFETVRQCMLAEDYQKAKDIFCYHLSEPRETCLGYATNGVCGKGIRTMAEYALSEIYNNTLLRHAIRRIEDIKLFVPNIGNDRVSDIYTNVIRQELIEFTQEQCRLHGQALIKKETSMYWNAETHRWEKAEDTEQFYWDVDGRPKLLVPKCFITRDTYNINRFNRYEVLPDFIQQELKNDDSPIITILKDGTRKVTKKDMINDLSRRGIILDKQNAQQHLEKHPNCIDDFRRTLLKQRERRKHK